MVISLTLALSAVIYCGSLFASAAPSSNHARQVVSGDGVLSAPTTGLVVAEGSSFSFSYGDSNWCEDGYSPITVWLTDYAPKTSSLNSTGQFPEGQYSYYYGSYLIPNFGLSALSGSTPPPSTLELPELDGITSGDTIYLSVVETGTNCPPGVDIPPQYKLTDTSIIVA